MIRSKCYSFVFAGVLLSLFATNARTQIWKRIGNLPPWTDLRCAYFWDTAHGVVGGVGCLYNYNNGVWTEGHYPEAIDTIKSLRLLDGYSLYAGSGVTCIWRSSDHGLNWQKTSALYPHADDINITWNGLKGINSRGIGMRRGTTFAQSNPRSAQAMIAWEDTVYTDSSYDGGDSIGLYPLPTSCGYSCIADTCQLLYYVISEGAEPILFKDENDSWIPIYDFGNGFNDVLAGGDRGVMYVQSRKSIWRSISGGVSWENIGGPGFSMGDRRMFAFGQYNRYLIVCDSNEVYLWDGGTNYLPTGPQPRVLYTQDIVDTGCTLPEVTVTLSPQSYTDTVRLHAYTLDNSTIEPVDTTIILPPGNTPVVIHYRTSVPYQQFSTTFYFKDTVTGRYNCGPFKYGEDRTINVRMPSYLQNILHARSIIDTTCSLDTMTVWFDMTTNPDTVRIHAYTNDGLYIEPADTMLIVPIGTGRYPIKYRAQLHPYQFASTFYFDDTVTGVYKCGFYEYATRDSSVVHLYPPPAPVKCSLKTPLKMSTCTDTKLPLVVKAPHTCDMLRIDSITWWDNTLKPQFDHYPPETLGPDEIDTFWVTLSALAPGIYNNVYYVHGVLTVVPQKYDTALTLSAIAAPAHNDVRVSVAPNVSLSNCHDSHVPLVLHGLSCDSVFFMSCTLTVDPLLQYTSNMTFSRMLSSGAADTMLLTFPPQDLNKSTMIYARFKGIYAGTSITFDTTVSIQVRFSSSASILIPDQPELDLGDVSLCAAPKDTVVPIHNFGCDTVVVRGDNTTWKAGWSASDPTFPIVLPPDSGFFVRVRFTPQTGSAPRQYVTFTFDAPGKPGETSVDMILNASTSYPAATFALTGTSLNAGALSSCFGDTTISTSISNVGCDTMVISNAQLNGDAAFAIEVIPDSLIAVNASTAFKIRFEPRTKGMHSATLSFHVQSKNGNDAGRDTTITIAGIGTATPSTVSLPITSITFPQHIAGCENDSATISLTNTSCKAIVIDSAILTSPSFSRRGPGGGPVGDTLTPNSTWVTTLLYLPQTIGDNSSSLRIFYHGDDGTEHDTAIALNATAIAPPSLAVYLHPGMLTAKDTGHVHIPIYAIGTGGTASLQSLALRSISFRLSMPADLLTPVAVTSTLDSGTPTLLADRSGANISIPLPPSFTPTTETEIARLDCEAYLTDVMSGKVALSGVATEPAPSKCYTLTSDTLTTMTFAYAPGCDDTLLSRVVNERIFKVESIVPNPAKNEIWVRILNFGDPVAGDLYDALGHHALGVSDVRSTSIPVTSLPSGTYYLRLSSGGHVTTRRIEIEK